MDAKPKPLTEFGCPCIIQMSGERQCNYDLLPLINLTVTKPQRIVCPGCDQGVIIEVVATVSQLAEANAWPEKGGG